MNRKICVVALRASYCIYTQRNYNWKEIEILKFDKLKYVYFFCIRATSKICFSLEKLIHFKLIHFNVLIVKVQNIILK